MVANPMARTIWHVVADVTIPSPEPFMVLRVDTSIKCDNGVEGTVISLHSIREEAEANAARFNGEMFQ